MYKMAEGRFATVINCMDGRVQIPVIEFMQKKYSVDYVDDVTEAGPDCILCSAGPELDSIRKRVEISVKKHGSHVIAVVGHHDCAGNPVDEDVHLVNIKQSVLQVSKWFEGVQVIGLWVDCKWKIHEVV